MAMLKARSLTEIPELFAIIEDQFVTAKQSCPSLCSACRIQAKLDLDKKGAKTTEPHICATDPEAFRLMTIKRIFDVMNKWKILDLYDGQETAKKQKKIVEAFDYLYQSWNNDFWRLDVFRELTR